MKKISKDKIKTWLVTGASSGIGKELCRQLLARGYNVIAISRRHLDFTHENLHYIQCDISNPEDVSNAVREGINKFGKIDVLSNNAGISSYGTIEEETPEKMRQVMEINFWGAYNIIRVIVPHFRKHKNGTIINNTSECGIMPRAYGSAYCSSKHALEGLTGALWQETNSFCRIMAIELSYFAGTEIGKNEKKGYSEIDEYKGLKWIAAKYKPCQNNKEIAIKHIINTVENKKLPRRLMLGRDILPKVKYEIVLLIKNYLNSYLKAYSCKVKNNL